MGAMSLMIGYIEEPFICNQQRDCLIKDHNRAKIMTLPRIDDWPPLTRTLFNLTGPEETYHHSLIYFGGTFKQIETEWAEWLEKFEGLLRSMIWIRVKLMLESSYYGDYTYTWTATDKAIEAFNQEFPERVKDWTFDGGPRGF